MTVRFRFGGGKLGGASVPISTGPTLGRDAEIAADRPRVVADPGGGVEFSTLAELTGTGPKSITANPTGTKFVKRGGSQTLLVSGTYNVGTKNPDIWFPGHALDAAPTCPIIAGGGQVGVALDGTMQIHGGAWQGFSSSTLRFLANSLLEDALFRENVDGGFTLNGDNCEARYFESHDNGENGFRCNGPPPDVLSGLFIHHFTTHHNNTLGLGPGGNVAGFKATRCDGNNVAEHFYIHDEPSWGAWTDHAAGVGMGGWIDREAIVENCSRSGVFLEGVAGGCGVERIAFKNNGKAVTIGPQPATDRNTPNLRINNSDSSLGSGIRGFVRNCSFDSTLTGLSNQGILLHIDNHDAHPDRCRNWDIEDNEFILRDSVSDRVGGLDVATTGVILSDGDIHFRRNHYIVNSLSATYWQWMLAGSRSEIDEPWADWQSVHGMDTDGTRESL
jgi:hypothetical protein